MAADPISLGATKEVDDALLFSYDEKDLDVYSSTNSEFDSTLRGRWDSAMEKGYFRYSLGQLETRVVPGKHGFVIMLNVLRGTERRKPQPIVTVNAPFQPEQFNFTKVHPREVLMYLVPRHRQDSATKNAVLINVSPFEYGNVLLVPDVDGCWPQVPTEAAIQLVIEMMMLNRSRAFRLGFNGLCALSSVNHLHFHAYYLEHSLRVEQLAVDHVTGQLFELTDHPARAFAFQVTQPRDIEPISRLIFALCQFLAKMEVAQNTFVTRGNGFEAPGEEVIRIFVFPRVSVPGGYDGNFHIACVELAGHIPMNKEELFRNVTEDDILEIFNRYAFDEASFEKLKLDFVSHHLNACTHS